MSLSDTSLAVLRANGLLDLWEKVSAGERLDAADGLRLYETDDITAIGVMADHVRRRLHGDVVYFNRNLHINATNVCEASCIFCSFARLETGDPDSWTLSIEQAVARVRLLSGELITEVHIVNGLNPDLPYDYYLDLLRAIKAERPDLHIKGFTAVEVHYYAEKYGMSTREVLTSLRAAGLDSLPGGGAEIFADRARRKLCHDKVSSQGWLDIHETAHQMGMRTNATMLFGSIETLEERVDHTLRLRDLQDRSLRAGATDPAHAGGRFQTFIPLRFHNDNNRLQRLPSPTGLDSLRTIAVSRLLLDNFPHVKAYWPMLGTKEAQGALHFGSSDLDGTVREEHIYHMAGAKTPQGLGRDELVQFIAHAGRTPVERDTLYNIVRRDDPADPPAQLVPARVGAVAYTNARPLLRHLGAHLDLREGHPAEVAAWLDDGQVDVALVPVAALLTDGRDPQSGGWRVVPDLAIGAEAKVESVLLVGEQAPESWTRVLLDGVSRTSVVLARLLLQHGPLGDQLAPDVEIVEVDAGTALAQATGSTAALVIGDAARRLPAQLSHRIDLAESWTNWTGLPFVFAVWAGRPDLDPDVVAHIRHAGARGIADLAAPATSEDGRYLREALRYPLDDRAMMGLRRFASLAFRAGLVSRETISLYSPERLRPRAGGTDTSVSHPQIDHLSRSGARSRVDRLLAHSADGGRLSMDDAMVLEQHAPTMDLMAAADLRRRVLHPHDAVTYIISRNVNYTNICVTACKFCAFYRPKNHREAYVLSRDQMRGKLQELVDVGGVEVLLQGGLNPKLGIEYYEELFSWIKSEFPLDLHALSPEEIHHIMDISGLTLGQTLDRLVASGMDSLPGGGAEVLDDAVRKRIAPLKCTSDQWLEVMREAHIRGMKASSTLMFGVGEQPEHRVRHLLKLRDLQDETNGFTAFICWTFQPDNTYVRPSNNTGAEWLRVNALSRLVLDNFANIQASWVTQGPGLAQASLHAGCNDFGSVMLEENVVSAAGTTFSMTVADVERNIRTAGFRPIRRNASYDHVGEALTQAGVRLRPVPTVPRAR